MAFIQEIVTQELYRCYHCGLESTGDSFKYFDNKKVDQPRFQCQHCHKFFTVGLHGRPQGKTYTKKRNEDPAELKSLSRQCSRCGVADNALFKYYNNSNLLQPRFKCLSCGKQFQMRLLGTGKERRLVHTSSIKTRAPRCRKQDMSEPFPIAFSSSEDGGYQPFDESFMLVPSDPLMSVEPGARLLPEMSDEDMQYSNFLETKLAEEENIQVDPVSWTDNGDIGSMPPPLSDETAEHVHCLETQLLAEENNQAPAIDAFSSAANVDDVWPPAWSNEDPELLDFSEAGVRDNEALDFDMVSDNMSEMVSESTSENTEVMYGTLVVDKPTTSGYDSWTWSHNDTSMDPSSMSYADAAAACCRQIDMDTARKNSILSVAPVQPIGSECSSSSAGSTTVFAVPFRVIPEPHLLQQFLIDDEQCSDFHWNEGEEAEEDMQMAPWAY